LIARCKQWDAVTEEHIEPKYPGLQVEWEATVCYERRIEMQRRNRSADRAAGKGYYEKQCVG
jgi:hypothetical protein